MFCLGVKIVLNGAGGGVGKGKQYSTTGVKVYWWNRLSRCVDFFLVLVKRVGFDFGVIFSCARVLVS